MAVGAVMAFWGTSFLLVCTPGADWAYMITAGLRNRSVVPAAAGLLLGYVVLTCVVAAGVAALVAGTPMVLGGLTVVGAVYLVWLGTDTLLHPATPTAAEEGLSHASGLSQALKGVGISGMNPKALLLFLALLPQFTDVASVWPMGLQILLLGLVHILSCAVVYSGVGLGARTLLRARPTLARAVSRLSGAAMVTIGLVLLLHQFAG